jgi:hypothetical protein
VIANNAVNADIARDRAEIGGAKPSETHANLEGVGMTAHKPFGIPVELWGRGGIVGYRSGGCRTSRMIEELEDQTLYCGDGRDTEKFGIETH